MSSRDNATRWMSVVLLSAAACSAEAPSPEPGVAAPAEATASTELATGEATFAGDSAELARRAVFAPCAEDPELECGELVVPVDYARPHGASVTLATIRAPAFAHHKKGILFVNPGGPGGSGVDFVIQAKPLFAALRQSFDVVSFDPRGTARSHSIDCTFELPPTPSDGTLAALAAFLDEAGVRYARACREQHGALATEVGTDNVARDVDVFRAALGEREVNYLGFSYGTALGTAYAMLFPHRVRAMVLDGNVSPAWFSDYLLELDADGSAGAELALRRLEQLCSAAADCPLGAAGVVAVYDRVVDRLNRDPVFVPGGVITGASVTSLVFRLLYQEAFGWPAIVQVLALADGGDYSPLPPLPTDEGSTTTPPSTFAIVCNDSATRRLGLDYLPAQGGNNAMYPRFGGANFALAITACSAWPHASVAPVKTLRTRNPVVLLGNDFDPATPMAWSRNLAAALGPKATLVRYQGGGHTVYGSLIGGGSACIDDAVEAYLRDLTVPPKGLTCAAQSLGFAATQRVAGGKTMAEILGQVAPPATTTLPRRR